MTATSNAGGLQIGSWSLDALNLVVLACLIYGITTETRLGLGGSPLVVLVLLVVASACWVARIRYRISPSPSGMVVLGTMALAGGALAAFATLAVVYVGVVGISATILYRLRSAVIITALGPIAMAIAVPADGQSFGFVVSGLAAAFGGMILGLGRRQAAERSEQVAVLQLTTDRAELARARAELLEERNRLAREIHDVLAHTLSALSLQLEALRSVAEASPGTPAALTEQLEQSQRLVREGLAEARGAVRALRDDARPITDQLERLCNERQARLVVTGDVRPIGPEATLALFRVAQEALTNALKHAPGSDVVVGLGYRPGNVVVSIDNSAPVPGASPQLSATGGGYGLQGIKERVVLLGGRVEAGPWRSGWRVEVEVPA